MLVLLTLLTAAYGVVVARVWRAKRAARQVPPVLALEVPAEDLPPRSAVGWPPGGAAFGPYVEEGIAALDAYLAEGFTA